MHDKYGIDTRGWKPDEYMIAEIKELRAALASSATTEQPRTQMVPMQHDDGRKGWYFDCDGYYVDIEQDLDGRLSGYMIDRKTRKQFWFDQSDKAAPVTDLAAAILALPLPEPMEINWPTLNSNALGCGVEDRNIRDRYQAAEYGWENGLDKAVECVPEKIYTEDDLRTLLSAAAALAKQVPAQEQDTASIDQQFLAVANDVRFACMKLYSPDDTATDWADKMAELKLVPIIRAARAAQLAQSADTEEG